MIRWCRNWLAWVLVTIAVDALATTDVRTRLRNALYAEKRLMNSPQSGPYATHSDNRKASL